MQRIAGYKNMRNIILQYPAIECTYHDHVSNTMIRIKNLFDSYQNKTHFSVMAAWYIIDEKRFSPKPKCETCRKLLKAHRQFIRAFYEAKHGWKSM